MGIVNDLIGDEYDVATGDRHVPVSNGVTARIRQCEYDACAVEFVPKRRGQRFHTQRCAALHNARREYGPTGKPAKVVEEDQAVVEAIWIEAPVRPLQPFSAAELTLVAELVGIDPAKVRGVAYLTALKIAVAS